MENQTRDTAEIMRERFALLPQVVQNAITSADISKRLRELAQTHQLHVDQWETLESEVQLTLLGMQHIEDLPKNIATELNMSVEQAAPLAADISRIVFEPIRQELERQLEHPEAKEAAQTAVDVVREQAQTANSNESVSSVSTGGAAAVQPTTTGQGGGTAPAPTIERAPAAAPAYTSGGASHERREVAGDPYREQV